LSTLHQVNSVVLVAANSIQNDWIAVDPDNPISSLFLD
jgi:hypothetical protein